MSPKKMDIAVAIAAPRYPNFFTKTIVNIIFMMDANINITEGTKRFILAFNTALDAFSMSGIKAGTINITVGK